VTLIELMIAIVIVAVLIGIGVPSFRNAALASRLSAVANNLLASAQLARSEAIKRNVPVRMCRSANGSTCAASNGWEQGWVVLDSTNAVIAAQAAVPADLRISQSGGYAPLVFQPIGIGATTTTFTVCRPDPLGEQERVFRVTASGNTSVSATWTGNCPAP